MQQGSTMDQLMRLVKDLGVEPQQPKGHLATGQGTAYRGLDADTDYIQKLLDDHDVGYYVKEKPGLRIYTLDECPFNPAHSRGGFLVNARTGQTGFHCYHNSCSEYKFRDAVAKIRSNRIN